MCQLKNFKCYEYFNNDLLVKTCFSLFINMVTFQRGDIDDASII